MSRRPRGAGYTFGGLSLAVLALIATLTITAPQAAPPAIAEFSPRAVEQIEKAPPEQSSSAGKGEGGATTDDGTPDTTTTTTPPPTIERARVRRCIGDPPRQTEDPQSPPCVPFFEGDNGGATTKGVTADEIRIAVPRDTQDAHLRAIEAYFNKRYELYGRKISLVKTGTFSAGCPEQRAAAAGLAALDLFAATDAGTANSACFYDELTRNEILVSEVSYAFTEAQMQARHPYKWSYLMSVDKLLASAGAMACGRLAGGKAQYSSDPATRGAPRKYGAILMTSNRDDALSVDPLASALRRCGIELAETAVFDVSEEDGTRGRDAVLRMQNAGVTTIFCFCVIIFEATLAPAATSQLYFPEWVLGSYGSNDYDVLTKASWPDSRQRQAMLGITSQPPQMPLSQSYAWAAYREADPSIRADHATSINLTTLYRSLLLLVSGIQLAGPNLTPATFAAGLQTASFPNPPDPLNSGAVGFAGPDHSMTDDSAEMWWSDGGTGADGSSGAWCYVEGAARRRASAWPTGLAPFFQGPCDSGA